MSADNPTPPQGVPSNKELFELAHTWDNYVGILKGTLYSEFREIRDRTLAAQQRQLDVLRYDNALDKCAIRRTINLHNEKLTRISELEAELKSVRANLIEAKRLITSVLTTYTEDQHRVTSDDCRMWLERHRHLPLERAAEEAEKE